MGDAGLTGRKIIVDTYGGMARHGGGAFSGKDPSKVDRSAAYAMRWVAKNVVAAGLAERCEVQVAYAIGKARPVGTFVDTFGTGTVADQKIQDAILEVFDLRPAAIIRDLDLLRPIYAQTAAYGHFGRPELDFTWESTARVDALKAAVTDRGNAAGGKRVGQQADERLELEVDAHDARRRSRRVRGRARPSLVVDELGDAGVDGLRGDDAPRGDRLVLTDAVDAVDGLGLLGVGPGQLGEHDVGGDLQVDAHAGRGQGADDDVDVVVVDERVDVLLPHAGGLVAADRAVADAPLGEGLLGRVHHVDVLGEEDDLAGAAGQLRGVVGGEAGLGLADAPHHGEHVLAGAVLAGVAQFPRADLTHQIEVDIAGPVDVLATATALS